MDGSVIVSSKLRLSLDLPPSCMQFCPGNPDFFVIGTYNLERSDSDVDSQSTEPEEAVKKPQNRNGSLVVFRLDGDDVQRIQTELQPSALLDLRFNPHENGTAAILAAVSSTGTLSIFKFTPANQQPLLHLTTSRCEDLDEDVLFLQCNWHPILSNVLAVTTSSGIARLLYVDKNWSIRAWLDVDVPNSLEAWCINIDTSESSDPDSSCLSNIYCGGDDSILRYTQGSLQAHVNGLTLDAPHSPVEIRGLHDAGVTAILPLSHTTANGDRIVLTGSYDDHLRVVSIGDLNQTYGMKRVRTMAEANLGGGVWRLNLIDASDQYPLRIRILVSCMHAGARIVEVRSEDKSSWDIVVLARFEEHQSMNYASDFVHHGNQGGLRCVSTSFYDRLLCLWDYGA